MKYIWRGTHENRHIPKSANFRWDPIGKCWWSEDANKAAQIRSHLSEDQQEELDRELALKQESLDASHATNSDREIPAPAGLAYLPFQKAGIVYASERKNTLIGDEMGLGKTIQAIGVINLKAEIKSVLVVCPASLKLNWKRELTKWLTRPLSISIANGTFEETDVVIINYDILVKHGAKIRQRAWDLLVLDEVHYAKNPKAIRSKEIWGGKAGEGKKEPIQAASTIAMTGTPILNKPVEMWSLLKHFGVFKSWRYFVTNYCAGYEGQWGWDVSGASKLDELQGILRESCMVRRMKADVLKELPAKRRGLIVLQRNGFEDIIKKGNDIETAVKEDVARLKSEAEALKAFPPSDEAYKEAVSKLAGAKRFAFQEIGRACYEIAMAKVPVAVEHIKNILESTDKVVVFAHHHDVLDALMAGLSEYDPFLFRGDMSMKVRDESVSRFINDKECKIFCGSIGAAGVGLTLTVASTVVFIELDWVPGNMSQAEDRCHRIGQTDSVLVQHIVVDGSIDQRMAERLIEKQEIIDAALNGKRESDKIKENDVQAFPENPSKPVQPEPVQPEAQQTRDPNAPKSKKEKIAELALTLTPEMIAEIHGKLKQVAGDDPDHASTVNGVGFSKFDGEIGHELAARSYLSPKQAAFAMMLVRKYKRQCGELSWLVKEKEAE